ncbi:helix-turn-helix transcriptional regulator, partial [Nanoarchaeota archaeon]
SKRAKDIMETLTDKEKEVVNFIIKSKGETTQAKVYHETGIAKSSLHRQVKSLENKKVIDVMKVGKVKKIKFTDWFLGKEKTKKK